MLKAKKLTDSWITVREPVGLKPSLFKRWRFCLTTYSGAAGGSMGGGPIMKLPNCGLTMMMLSPA
jgi:hypothetical protein